MAACGRYPLPQCMHPSSALTSSTTSFAGNLLGWLVCWLVSCWLVGLVCPCILNPCTSGLGIVFAAAPAGGALCHTLPSVCPQHPWCVALDRVPAHPPLPRGHLHRLQAPQRVGGRDQAACVQVPSGDGGRAHGGSAHRLPRVWACFKRLMAPAPAPCAC